MESDVIIGHSVCLHDVHIKPRCVIGMGSILLFNVICEEDVIVASGSVVMSGTHIPAGKLVAGNPARILKDVTPERKHEVEEGVKACQMLCKLYREKQKKIDLKDCL